MYYIDAVPDHMNGNIRRIFFPCHFLNIVTVSVQELRAENEQLKTQTTTQFHELMKARAEAFELREQLKLLHDEVAQSRLPVDRTKNSVKFNTSKKSYWECDKTSRSQ